MSFEDFDKKIREAAEHHHPSYDEKAWKGMKKLLDKHLPEEDKDRRRIFFILFLALLLGGSAFLLLGRTGKKQPETARVPATTATGTQGSAISTTDKQTNKPEIIVKENNDPRQPINKNESTVSTVRNHPAGELVRIADGPSQNELKKNQPANIASKDLPVTNFKKGKQDDLQQPPVAVTKEKRKVPDITQNNPDAADIPGRGITKDNTVKKENRNPLPVIANPEPVQAENKPVQADNKVATPAEKDKTTLPAGAVQPPQPDKKVEIPVSDAKVSNDKKKQVARKKNSFSLSFSAGPDVSYAGGEQWGKTNLVLGLGVGYSIGERLLIRSGFFTAKKVYDASPKSYNPPQDFYTYYPYLYGVNANCNVYEIPLLFSYRFGRSAKQKGLLTAGLSSYIMQRETYDYTFSYVPSGPLYKQRYSMKNENEHWFSVLTLSGGYQRQLGKNISLVAEPYVKLPLSGVGFGKVKLNSAGILFTVGINPFAEKSIRKKSKPGIH